MTLYVRVNVMSCQQNRRLSPLSIKNSIFKKTAPTITWFNLRAFELDDSACDWIRVNALPSSTYSNISGYGIENFKKTRKCSSLIKFHSQETFYEPPKHVSLPACWIFNLTFVRSPICAMSNFFRKIFNDLFSNSKSALSKKGLGRPRVVNEGENVTEVSVM